MARGSTSRTKQGGTSLGDMMQQEQSRIKELGRIATTPGQQAHEKTLAREARNKAKAAQAKGNKATNSPRQTNTNNESQKNKESQKNEVENLRSEVEHWKAELRKKENQIASETRLKEETESQLSSANQEIENLKVQQCSVAKERDDLLQKTATLEAQLRQAVSEGKGVLSERDELLRTKKELQQSLQDSRDALVEAGKHCKSEEKSDVKKWCKSYMKDYGWSHFKFVSTEEKKTELAEAAYHHMCDVYEMGKEGGSNYMSLKTFQRVYTGFLCTQLCIRRQNAQSSLRKACYGELSCLLPTNPTPNYSPIGATVYHSKHNVIPKAEELLNVWKLPSKAAQGYQKAVDMLIWYMDYFLPAAVGALSVYGPRVRHYRMPVDRKNVNGKMETIVTILSEAFGLVVLKNCHEKWSRCADEKKKDPDWKVPLLTKDNKHEVQKYHRTMWSDSSSGQHSGWDPAAIKCLNGFTKNVRDFRVQDSKQHWVCHKEGLRLLREHHNINTWEHSKKRKRRTVEKQLQVYEDEDVMDTNEDDIYAGQEQDIQGQDSQSGAASSSGGISDDSRSDSE